MTLLNFPYLSHFFHVNCQTKLLLYRPKKNYIEVQKIKLKWSSYCIFCGNWILLRKKFLGIILEKKALNVNLEKFCQISFFMKIRIFYHIFWIMLLFELYEFTGYKLLEKNNSKDAISIFSQSLLIHSSGVVISSESITQTTSWLLYALLYKPIFFLSCESLLSCGSWNWITFWILPEGKISVAP